MQEKYIIMVDGPYTTAAAATENKPDESNSKIGAPDYFGINPDYIVRSIIQKAAPFVNGSDRLLRVQWYDAIKEGEDQQLKTLSSVASVDSIRFCQCRQNSFGKIKGVLSQIVVDAMVMINAKAIDTLVLVSGDENFYPLIEFAKNNGVKFVLIGVGESKARMSLALISEADAYDYIDAKNEGVKGRYGLKSLNTLSEYDLQIINKSSRINHNQNPSPVNLPVNNLAGPGIDFDIDISKFLPPSRDFLPQDIKPFVEEIIDDMSESTREEFLSEIRNTEDGQVVDIPPSIDRILILAVKHKIGRMLTIGEKHSVRDLAVAHGESLVDD